MKHTKNALGQPVGMDIKGWQFAVAPTRTPLEGSFCRLEPLDPEAHLEGLYDAFGEDPDGALWTYMVVGPFDSRKRFRAWLESVSGRNDPLFFAIIDKAANRAAGLAAYMRIRPGDGVIEVGSIVFSPRLRRSRAATEAMYLLMDRAFSELGFRRYEWKCDALNAASRKAAERLGFSCDGIFEQATVYKGRNRDTAWYSILDRDWPALRNAYVAWLDPDNFDNKGIQKRALGEFVSRARTAAGQARPREFARKRRGRASVRTGP